MGPRHCPLSFSLPSGRNTSPRNNNSKPLRVASPAIGVSQNLSKAAKKALSEASRQGVPVATSCNDTNNAAVALPSDLHSMQSHAALQQAVCLPTQSPRSRYPSYSNDWCPLPPKMCNWPHHLQTFSVALAKFSKIRPPQDLTA